MARRPITENSTAAELWAYYQTFWKPLAQSFQITANKSKEARADADRLGHALRAAEARIKELQREVAKLDHYREVVEAALMEAE